MLYQSVLLFLAFAFCKGLNNQSFPVAASVNGDKCTYIGGKKVFLTIQGNKSPTVVFVSALGEDHTNWKEVQEAVSNLQQP